MLKNIFITIIISTLIISCSHKGDHKYNPLYKVPRPVHTLTDKEASLAVATGVRTGHPFVIDSLHGKEQPPCTNPNINNNPQDYSNKGHHPRERSSDCKLKVVKPSAELLNAIKKTQSPIPGIIYKDGKEISIKFHQVLIAAYDGSYCTTIFSSGVEYQKCVTQQQTCQSKRNAVLFLSLAQFLAYEPQCNGLVSQ